jgi:hypothetical protein
MAKIDLDKYYTPDDVALYCINKTYEIIGRDNITHIVEPSAGAGAFYLHIPDCEGYDIAPECEGVIEQDFLKLWLPYQHGRLLIGNPPFGGKGDPILKKFYHQACGMGDYIVWILPIRQLNNTSKLYEFDLVHSEDLGKIPYSGVNLHCCFNIYKRPDGLMENRFVKETLSDVSIRMLGRDKEELHSYKVSDFDYCFTCWGTLGVPCETMFQYTNIMCINVNREDIKEEILDALYAMNHDDWIKIYPSIASPCLSVWQIVKFLKSSFPDLK